MRANQDTVVRGRTTVLVPYRRHHVPLYHAWMVRAERPAGRQLRRPFNPAYGLLFCTAGP